MYVPALSGVLFLRVFIIFLSVIFCFLSVFTSGAAFADVKTKNVRGENLLIVENNKLFGLKDKMSGQEILPVMYSDIKKIKYKNDTVFVGNYGYHKAFYSPEGLYDDFLFEYYSAFPDVKFKNYPKNGSIIYKNKNGKVGVVTVKDGILYVTDAIFEKAVYPDGNSLISKCLNISFASTEQIFLYFNDERSAVSLKNYIESGFFDKVLNGKIIIPKANVSENIFVSNNVINSEYNYINFASDEFFAVFDRKTIYENRLNVTFSPVFRQNRQRLYSTEEFYELIENTYNIELKNYPEDFTLFDTDRAETIKDGRYSEIADVIPDTSCSCSLISTITGLKISFQNTDSVIFREKGKYGMTDRYGNIRVPFIYDKLRPLVCNTSENISYNSETKKMIITYNGGDNDGKYFVASKNIYDKETGQKKRNDYLIDSANKILAAFDNGDFSEYEGMKHATGEAANITKSDINTENRRMFFKRLPGNLAEAALNIVFLPFLLVCPEFASVFAEINYFK